MAINYLDIIGEYYPDAQATCIGNPEVYAEINWITDPIDQAELEAVYLTDYKTQKIIYFSELTREDIINGFVSTALGTPHLYDSQPEDQLNLTGSVASQLDMYYACYAYTAGSQIVDVGGTKTETDSTGFANDLTTYNAEIIVDGVSAYLSIAGQDAQTYGDLIIEINNDVDFSAGAYAELVNGNIRIVSKTYGSASIVSIQDANLFSMLTGYQALLTAVDGLDAGDATKDYRFHTHSELLQVMQDGAAVKLTALQKFAVKQQQILSAASVASVDAITWN